jgi:hypothetical protein
MTSKTVVRAAAGYVAGGAALAALGYAAYAGAEWMRYGHATRERDPENQDSILDGFMPLYDIVERHHVRVAAPPAVTLAAARELDMSGCLLVRAIFKGRELMLGSLPAETQPPEGLMAQALSLGWGVLESRPEREIVLGAVTKPWEPNPVFRDLLPREFPVFAEPGFVKIAWTLRADPVGAGESVFRTETRAMATDIGARTKFRRYWAMVSPGVAVIRLALIAAVKQEAERRVALPVPVTVPV